MITWDHSGDSCCGPQMGWCGLKPSWRGRREPSKDGCRGLASWWMWSWWMEGRGLVCLQGSWKPFSAQMAFFPPLGCARLTGTLTAAYFLLSNLHLGCAALNAMETNEIWMAGLLSSLFFQDHCWLITLHVGQAAGEMLPIASYLRKVRLVHLSGTVKTAAVFLNSETLAGNQQID